MRASARCLYQGSQRRLLQRSRLQSNGHLFPAPFHTNLQSTSDKSDPGQLSDKHASTCSLYCCSHSRTTSPTLQWTALGGCTKRSTPWTRPECRSSPRASASFCGPRIGKTSSKRSSSSTQIAPRTGRRRRAPAALFEMMKRLREAARDLHLVTGRPRPASTSGRQTVRTTSLWTRTMLPRPSQTSCRLRDARKTLIGSTPRSNMAA